MYKWKRAIALAFMAYLISFVLGTVSTILLNGGIDTSQNIESIPAKVWISGLVLGMVISALMTTWYVNKVRANAVSGLLFGLTMIAVGAVVDALFLLPVLLNKDAAIDPFVYYLQPYFIVTVIAIVVVAVIVGALRGRKQPPVPATPPPSTPMPQA